VVVGGSRRRQEHAVSDEEIGIMIVTKKAISRRTVLRGMGTTLALPLLDAMVPALTITAKTAAQPVKRFGVVYVPNGIIMNQWTPAATGAGFAFTPTLKPLEPFREHVLVVSGLVNEAGRGGSAHPGKSAAFLTGLVAARTVGNTQLRLGTSMDQFAADVLGRETQLPSLELSLEGTDSNVVAICDPGYSCAYMNISWRNETTPMPRETNPRIVFERLFGTSGSSDAAVRLARIKRSASVLDSVREKVGDLQRGLASDDRAKLGEYLESVRDVERRLQKAEEQSTREVPEVESPAGIPVSYDEHARLMFDLQVLAYRSDLTRVITFMFGRELSGATYPQIGVTDSHHPITHHLNEAENVVKVAKINAYHASLFAYFVRKLHETPDGDGSLLDHLVMLYGSPISDGNSHSPDNLPIVLVGGGGGRLKGARHVKYEKGMLLPNLQLTLLDKLGVHIDHLGNSTGKLIELSEV
jgi:hypothetical protein